MKANRPTLGVVAISRNEETDLPGFLEHLLPWADEIVIIDDDSTDATADIAKAAGSKVQFLRRTRDEETGFAGQRNFGIKAARSDWLLHLDIDERVTPDLMREISRAMQNPAQDGYRYRRLNFFLHRPMRGGGFQTWNNVQLARRGKHQFANRLHEICHVDGPVGQLNGLMWHLADSDYSERLRKNAAYMLVQAQDWMESGFQVRWFHFVILPLWYFLKPYILQRGWLDGMPGLIWAMHCGSGAARLMAMIWDSQHRISRAETEAQFRQLGSRLPQSQLSDVSVPTSRAGGCFQKWFEKIEGKLRARLTSLGERSEANWLIYNPLVMRYYHELALREAPAVITSFQKLFPDARHYADVGSGTGAYAAEATRRGLPTIALEYNWFGRWMARQQGTESRLLDLNQAEPWKPPKVDLAYSIEVAEHLPPPLGRRLVQYLCCITDRVVFTAAPPEQEGTGHINLQPQSYWIDAFNKCGFAYDSARTETLVELFQKHGTKARWLAKNAMVLVRSEPARGVPSAPLRARPGTLDAIDYEPKLSSNNA